MTQPWFFEDFTEGQTLPVGSLSVRPDHEEWFATTFAPSVEGSRTDGAPPLSPWHVSALGMRLICDAFLLRTASLGSPGIDEVEWQAPVRVGDQLTLSGVISTLRASRSRPDMGLIGVKLRVTNQHGACVMRQSNVILVQRRTQGVRP